MSIQSSRPTGVNLKPEDREQIKALYLQGLSTAEIARRVGVNKSTVSRLTLREGLREKLDIAGKRLTDDEIWQIKNLFTTTYLSKQVIADRLGISFDSVQHHTKGLTRQFDEGKKRAIVELYLAGELTASDIRAKEGITKKMLYAMIREYKGEIVNG